MGDSFPPNVQQIGEDDIKCEHCSFYKHAGAAEKLRMHTKFECTSTLTLALLW